MGAQGSGAPHVNRGPSSHAASRHRPHVVLRFSVISPEAGRASPCPRLPAGGYLWRSFISPLLVSAPLSGDVSAVSLKSCLSLRALL